MIGVAITPDSRREYYYYYYLLLHTEGTDRDRGQQTLRYICDDDADEKDDGVEPIVAENESNDEERDSKEDCDAGDQVNEVLNLA